MHLNRQLLLGTVLLSWPANITAKDDPNYNPSQNFRPGNVTGLNGIYAWVGSYYNTTTVLEVTPTMGRTINVPLCPALQDYTARIEMKTTLMITDRGEYNQGANAANFFILKERDTFGVNSAPPELESGWTQESWPWLMKSSEPTWKYQENHTTIPDSINITTTTSLNNSRYSLGGLITSRSAGGVPIPAFNISMPACNSSEEVDVYIFSVLTETPGSWWSTVGWDDYQQPSMSGYFDQEEARLEIQGDFAAYSFLRPNSTDEINYGGSGTTGGSVQGTFTMVTKGVVDEYHSDSLVVAEGDSPTWLRTVGFHNDSGDIGYDSGSARGHTAGPLMGSVAILGFLVLGLHIL